MSVTDLMTQLVTLERTDTITRNEIGEAEMATETSTPVQAFIEPQPDRNSSDEDLNTRGTQIGDWWGFLPPGTDVTGWDRLVYGEHTFDIIGPPRPFVNPRTQTESHIQVNLREVI